MVPSFKGSGGRLTEGYDVIREQSSGGKAYRVEKREGGREGMASLLALCLDFVI